MKTVVLELKKGQAAVLGTDGCVYIVEDRGYAVGETPELDEFTLRSGAAAPKRLRGLQRILPMAAAIAIFTMAGGVSAYAMPCSTVTLDVNPSVTYSLNVFDRVLSMTSADEESDAVVDAAKPLVRGKKLQTAVQITLDALSDREYIEEEETDVVFSVDSVFRREGKLEKMLSEGVDAWNDMHAERGISAEPTTVRVTRELKEEARELKTTPGRAYLIDKVRDAAPEGEPFDAGDWTGRSVRELKDAALDYRSFISEEAEDMQFPSDMPVVRPETEALSGSEIRPEADISPAPETRPEPEDVPAPEIPPEVETSSVPEAVPEAEAPSVPAEPPEMTGGQSGPERPEAGDGPPEASDREQPEGFPGMTRQEMPGKNDFGVGGPFNAS
ncbi:MAG: hypothetical protein J6I56_04115 [Lachnospiraceae bacterium]|nr:hypothetical protein [Lachnospiraceae bacterium]